MIVSIVNMLRATESKVIVYVFAVYIAPSALLELPNVVSGCVESSVTEPLIVELELSVSSGPGLVAD